MGNQSAMMRLWLAAAVLAASAVAQGSHGAFWGFETPDKSRGLSVEQWEAEQDRLIAARNAKASVLASKPKPQRKVAQELPNIPISLSTPKPRPPERPLHIFANDSD